MKRTALALMLILALQFSAAGAMSLKLASANPFTFEYLPTPVHPKTTILSPENNTLQASNSLTISFNVSISFEKGESYLIDVVCQPSWQDAIGAYEYHLNKDHISELSYELNLTGIPEGNQTVMIRARGGGGYEDDRVYYGFDDAYSWDYISFTIASVSVLSPQNTTYDVSDVPLLFKAHETFTQISYSLDGQDKVMFSGNTTLTDLSNGDHNVTFYVMDEAGKTVASETTTFTVAKPEPFPTTLAITASGASVTVVGLGLLVYFKKRNHAKISKQSETEQSSA